MHKVAAIAVLLLGSVLGNAQSMSDWLAWQPVEKDFSVRIPSPMSIVSGFDGERGVYENGSDTFLFKDSRFYAVTSGLFENRMAIIVIDEKTTKKLRKGTAERGGFLSLSEMLAILFIGDDDEIQFMKEPFNRTINGLSAFQYLYERPASKYSTNQAQFSRGLVIDGESKIFLIIYKGVDLTDLHSRNASNFIESFTLQIK